VNEPLLEVRDLKKYFPVGGLLLGKVRGWVKAVDGISFTINAGETLGLVGESGCGKTTTSKLILVAEEPTAGIIEFEGRNIVGLTDKDLMDYRRKVQVVFQDPYSSLSPRMRIGEIIGEPIETHERVSQEEVRTRVGELLELVGLRPDMARLFPHEFSGGQRQRLAIARALSTNARLIVLDEPVSALDVSIRAHVISLLEEIQGRLGVSYLFIAHDLAAVAHISHQIAVMYLGKLVEVADSLELCANPLHPYTKALFAASLPSHPDEEKKEIVLSGEVPSALNPPSGCHFHPRCPFAMPRCSEREPDLIEVSPGHKVSCYLIRFFRLRCSTEPLQEILSRQNTVEKNSKQNQTHETKFQNPKRFRLEFVLFDHLNLFRILSFSLHVLRLCARHSLIRSSLHSEISNTFA